MAGLELLTFKSCTKPLQTMKNVFRFLCDGLATRARRPDGEEPDGHPRPPPEVGLENGSSNPEHPAE